METGKIKIKAKYFVKIKTAGILLAAEETNEMVLNDSFSFGNIIQSLAQDLNSGEFGYGWRLEGESAAV